ncbi:DUF423 domain-containing protein [Pararhizobium haloflavum]|uniref:DUF423 domain-containing protein n=1 Tax=Pararhizobium haloflavum TaxID=2037914 RepID=UPI000C175512|nr:DUF423 domain-containing protein [Pararhizobium haloflavum]
MTSSQLRIIAVLAGLLGAAGVALAAAASHGSDARLMASAAAMCLAHAPALLALGALSDRLRLAFPSGLLLAAGTLLFAADLVLRSRVGTGVFPMAAPAGGMGMIAGWILVSLGGLLGPGQRPGRT